MRPPVARLVAAASALLVQVFASGLPLHAHEEHSSSVAHVEHAHGGHDTVVLNDDERQKTDAPVAMVSAQRVMLLPDAAATRLDGVAEPLTPPARPAVAQPPPRAPPLFL